MRAERLQPRDGRSIQVMDMKLCRAAFEKTLRNRTAHVSKADETDRQFAAHENSFARLAARSS